MPMTFKEGLQEEIKDLQDAYFKAAREGEDDEVVEAAYAEYMAAFSESLKEDVVAEARKEAVTANSDKSVRMNRGENVLTSKEEKFFKNLVADDADLETYQEKLILPEETMIRVFEDMQAARPLLSKINFQLAGIKTRMIVGDPEGQAVWGEIFGKIQGQLDANFRELNFSQNKLTAFAVVPKDMVEFGPQWIERYIRTQLAEAFALQLERGVVNGGGAAVNEPYGLLKELQYDSREKGERNVTGVEDKEEEGQLTFADMRTTAKELAAVLTKLSVKEFDNKKVNVGDGASIAVNPQDRFMVGAQYTIQTPTGQWVTSLPYGVDVVPSDFIPEGKALVFIGSRYHAVQTGAVDIKAYDQTLALEDANVHIAKQFAHGIPDDNNVALLYDLAIDGLPENGNDNGGEEAPS